MGARVSRNERIVNVQEAKTHLSRLLREVEAGEEIAIARGGKVIARLVRSQDRPTREWGLFEGQVTADPDVFAPMTDEEAADWDDAPVLS